jgi:hypothetical protein
VNLTLFGGPESPLRPSQLDKLVKCSVWPILMIGEPEDGGGKAAQTGSAVHEAVAAYHLEPDLSKRIQAGQTALAAALPKFPLADSTEARLFLTPYMADPRNLYTRVVAVEQRVGLTLPPHPTDPTGAPIVVRGTLDQIREENGRLVVCDLKTGSPSGWQMVHDYAYQQSAYVLAARASGFPEAEPGYLIRCQGYRARTAALPSPDGVYWWCSWSVDDCHLLLERVRLEVARIRSGEVQFGAGPHCSYCPHGGLQGCIPRAKEKLGIALS